MFTPIITDHPLFNSKDYVSLQKKLDHPKIDDWLKKDYAKLFLSIVEDSKLLLNSNYLEQFKEELLWYINNVKDFEKVFLIYEEISRIYSSRNIFHNMGRGSSASSLICFTLGITKLDPIKHNIKWRILNDLDIDIDVPNRDLAINELKLKYPNKIALLGVKVLYTIKSAFREVMKDILPNKELFAKTKLLDDLSSGMQFNLRESFYLFASNMGQSEISVVTDVLDQMESEFDNNKKLVFKLLVKQNKELSDLFSYYQDEYNNILKLIGTVDRYGIHAGAIILSDNISKLSFIEKENKFNVPIVSWDSFDENKDMLMKVDLLSVSCLKDINSWIEKNKLDIDWMPYDYAFKKEKWETISNPKIFQCKYATKAKKLFGISVNNVEDFALLTALYRPSIIDLKQDNLRYDSPKSFYKYLKETHGIFIYQEQLLEIAKDILKLEDLNERALALKNFCKGRNLDQYKDRLTEEEFSYLKERSKYLFNKSHAIAYAYNTFFHSLTC